MACSDRRRSKARIVSSSSGIRSPGPLVLGVAPRRPGADRDDALVDPQRLASRRRGRPSGARAPRCGAARRARRGGTRPPSGARGSPRGTGSPRRRPTPTISFTLAGLATVRGSATRAAGLRGMIPSSTASASAARRTVRQICTLRRESSPAARQRFDPLGDVLAVESGDRDRAEPGLDVRDRPLVALSRLERDVGAAGDVSAHQPADRPAFGAAPVGLARARCRQRSALRRVRAELSRPMLAGRGVDAVDTHDPLVALLADRGCPVAFHPMPSPPVRISSQTIL